VCETHSLGTHALYIESVCVRVTHSLGTPYPLYFSILSCSCACETEKGRESERERESEWESERARERAREREREREFVVCAVCVLCVCAYLHVARVLVIMYVLKSRGMQETSVCVAVCSVLQCVAVCCSVLLCAARDFC